jgi:hypothetical protein
MLDNGIEYVTVCVASVIVLTGIESADACLHACGDG